MASSVDIVVNVVTKLKDTGVEQAQGKFGRMGSGLKKAMVPAVAAIGVIGAFGAAALDSASRLEQAIGATDSVFGRNAATVKRWADDSATSVGLAKAEYLELSNVLGAQLKNMGVPMEAVAGQTKNLVGLGADLAATFGGTTSEAVQALSSLMRGEADPIERYGVSIKQADIAAQMAADGTDKLRGEQAKAAKTQAMLTLLTKQTAAAQGGFARETDTAAHAQQVAAAQYENTKATLGEALLPIMVKVMGALTKMAEIVQRHPAAFQALIVVVLALAAAVVVLNVAMLILSANPIVLIIAAVVVGMIAMGAAIVMLYKKSALFRKIVTGAFAAVKVIIGVVATFLKTAFGVAFRLVSAYVRAYVLVAKVAFMAVRAAVNFVISAVRALVGWLKNIHIPDSIKRAFAAIRDIIAAVTDKVRDLIGKVADIVIPKGLAGPFDAMKAAIDKVIGAISSLISWLGKIKIPSGVSKILGKLGLRAALVPPPTASRAAVGLVSAPRLSRTAAVPAVSTGGTVININVTGAIDPEATARQIKRILAGHERRIGVRFG